MFKNSVFTRLFGEKEKLLELYNAIENTNYGSDTDIRITTLENVLISGILNDISFVIDGKIVVMMEHQSTINYNMPLRMLMYVTETYKKITEEENLYRKKAILIPKPEFIVLYNGDEEFPDQKTLKLSDMYLGAGTASSAELDLIVKVFNINNGRNEEILRRSDTLNGYGIFVSLVKKYMESMNRDPAILRAIDDCIRQNVLKRFLEENASEVRNMLITEWDNDKALKIAKEEAREDGWAEGNARGKAEGLAEGNVRGKAEERSYIKGLLEQGLSAEEILKRIKN
jgi:hypothetical protein